MLLYHGTNGAWLGNILRKGIEPRRNRPARDNWKQHSSHPDCVYLTDSYAPHFAMNACRGSKPSCAVIEIDTDRLHENDLFPDEDFLEQANRQAPEANRAKGDLAARVRFFRQNLFKHTWATGNEKYPMWWKASVGLLGTCAYRSVIPPSAMTRAVLWPHHPGLRFFWDPQITIANQQVCGDMYRAMTRKLFSGEFTDLSTVTTENKVHSIRDPEHAIVPVLPGWTLMEIRK